MRAFEVAQVIGRSPGFDLLLETMPGELRLVITLRLFQVPGPKRKVIALVIADLPFP